MGYKIDEFPASEQYYKEAISLPIYPGLTEEQQNEVVASLMSLNGYQTIF
jgi:dTDP-4-amino-4,6-dideoxygalactose transaminase